MISDQTKPRSIQLSNYKAVADSVIPKKYKRAEVQIVEWMALNGLSFLRVSVGIIYLWFGVVKFFPGLSPAETLAVNTISQLTFGYIPSNVSLPVLAVWECAVGVCLIFSRGMRVILIMLFLQMIGTFLPLILFIDKTWSGLFVPTLEGQYIIKNIIIVSSGIVLGATLHGGGLTADKRQQQSKKKEHRIVTERITVREL